MSIVFSEPSLGQDLQNIRDDIRALQNAQRMMSPAIETATPPNPYDGQQICIKGDADTTARSAALWNFRYNRLAPNFKWEYTGGVPVKSFAQPYINTVLAGGFATKVPVTNGPKLIVPYTGEYDLEWQLVVNLPSAASGGQHSADRAGSGIFIESSLSGYGGWSAGDNHKMGEARVALQSNDVIQTYLTIGGPAQNMMVYFVSMKLTPVRIK